MARVQIDAVPMFGLVETRTFLRSHGRNPVAVERECCIVQLRVTALDYHRGALVRYALGAPAWQCGAVGVPPEQTAAGFVPPGCGK